MALTQSKRDEVLYRIEHDPQYFIESAFRIVNKDRLDVPFLLNDPQKKYLANRTNYDLILKARKEGFSSLIAALWVHACIFKRNTRAVLMSHEDEATKRLFERVQYFINTIEIGGHKFKIRLGEDSKKQLTFPDTGSSFWIGTAGAKAFGRGDDITHCHCSEVAHYENQDNLDGLLQACVPNAYRVFETTANGVGEAFWRLWMESIAQGDESKWKRHFFAWFEDHTNRIKADGCTEAQLSETDRALKKKFNLDMGQILWYASKRQEMVKKELLVQENPSTPEEAFVMSGSNYFNQRKVQRLIEEAAEWTKENKPWKVERDSVYYDKPKTRCIYAAGADTSEGAHDYSVLKIINVTERKEAFRFRAKVGVDYFYKMCDKVCREYGTCLLGVERNNHGHAVLLGLQNDCHYPNLYFERNETRLVGDAFKTLKAGWLTTAQNKTMIFDQLKYAVEGEYEDDEDHFRPEITWIDDVFLSECLTIQDENGKLGAIPGRYDDNVVATAIAFQMYMIQKKYLGAGGESFDKLVAVQGRRQAI